MEMSIFHMQIARRHRLRSQSIEKCYVRSTGYAEVGIFQRLLLLRRLRNHLYPLRVEQSDVVAIAIEHFHRQHEVLPFVRIRNEQRFRRTILFAIVQVQLLHIVLRITDANECTQL